MEFGLFTEFESPAGMDQAVAFDESLAQTKAAEDLGPDAVWLAEIHFQKDRSVRVIYGSPGEVADRLLALREDLGFSGFFAWMNCGGQLPSERVLTSMRLFAERVIPRLS